MKYYFVSYVAKGGIYGRTGVEVDFRSSLNIRQFELDIAKETGLKEVIVNFFCECSEDIIKSMVVT
jgi:hypothetical protein